MHGMIRIKFSFFLCVCVCVLGRHNWYTVFHVKYRLIAQRLCIGVSTVNRADESGFGPRLKIFLGLPSKGGPAKHLDTKS
jgi:hypothetical protein